MTTGENKSYSFLKGTTNGNLLNKALASANSEGKSRIRFTEEDKIIALREFQSLKNTRKAYESFQQITKKQVLFGSFNAMLTRLNNNNYVVVVENGEAKLVGGPNTRIVKAKEVLKQASESVDLYETIFHTLYESNPKKTEDAILKVIQKETLQSRVSLIIKLLKPNRDLVAEALKPILNSH